MLEGEINKGGILMNKKADILNAWITIEQLSEGIIKKNDKNLREFNQSMNSGFDKIFLEHLTTQKHAQKVSDKAFEKSGIVLYFDIFNFQEIIDILRKKYKISATYEEINSSEKFTFALYFDNHLNFISEKLFFTISGYIRYKKELPEDFFKAESSLRDDLKKQFEDQNFDTVLTNLLKQYKVTLENCRYGYVKDLDVNDVNLHSFFIEDLQTAKHLETENLNRYFSGFSGKRINLDSQKASKSFNSKKFWEILQPKYYPLGRFPSNSNYSLTFMQEVTVNLALNEKNNILSVNGPPGTGKTTLLKDFFADLIVQQAIEICRLSNKEIKGSIIYWEKAKLGVLPDKISDKNIVVASSNNGAVQNIVNELPRIDQVSEEFRDKLLETDYFQSISNSKVNVNWLKKEGKMVRELSSEYLEEDNWGSFSLEGGTSANINKLLLTVESINKYFEEEYQPDFSIYQEFFKSYVELDSERSKVQSFFKKIQKLPSLKCQYQKDKENFFKEKKKKEIEIKTVQENGTRTQALLKSQIESTQKSLEIAKKEVEGLPQLFAEAQRNFDVIKSQEPNFLWLQKIFNKGKINSYFVSLNQANEELNEISKQRKFLKSKQADIELLLNGYINKFGAVQEKMRKTKYRFDNWIYTEESKVNNLEKKIDSLVKLKKQMKSNDLDLTQSYEELQKSNPWFTKEFRIKQSELFIKALQVRKQFLFENKKHLATARRIWNKQNVYAAKVNGEQLLKESWQWINFTIPIISTTFASFGRMFRNLPENSIANLFVDEAGQALPQASVGAVFRSKKIMVVGDPSQIKPVLTLDSNVLNLLGKNYQVNEKFISSGASTQTIVDDTSQYGFQKTDDEWIGIPLWVHRRSDYPMFTISNEISYNGMMVQGKPKESAKGKSEWFHVSGKANDKFVKEQAELLSDKIKERLQREPNLAEDIYVISPFKNVAYQLTQVLNKIGFTKYENGKAINVGTVHTFQGKEAKIVYFVLGADTSSKGSAKWAVSEPNMMNVAATRAKEEFYIIGDKKLYATIGSSVANRTISIIDNYMEQGLR